MHIPDAVSPSFGWRAWQLDGHLLTSPVRANTWLPHEAFSASCPLHIPPEESCTCGVYVANLPTQTTSFLWGHRSGRAPVLGQVALWGKLVEHATGFRAQFAYPTKLYVRSVQLSSLGPILAQSYGVPIGSIEADVLPKHLTLIAYIRHVDKVIVPLLLVIGASLLFFAATTSMLSALTALQVIDFGLRLAVTFFNLLSISYGLWRAEVYYDLGLRQSWVNISWLVAGTGFLIAGSAALNFASSHLLGLL